jgi:hypothetical protein
MILTMQQNNLPVSFSLNKVCPPCIVCVSLAVGESFDDVEIRLLDYQILETTSLT